MASSKGHPNGESDGLSEEVVDLRSGDGHSVEVDSAVVSQLGLIRKGIIKPEEETSTSRPVYNLPGITRDTLDVVITLLCNNQFSPEILFDRLHLITLFNVIQASHHLEIQSLMNLSCRALVTKVEAKGSDQIIQQHSVINKQNVQSHTQISSILKKRVKQVSTNESLVVDVQCSPLVAAHLGFVQRRKTRVDQYASKMMIVRTAGKELEEVLDKLHRWISGDLRLAGRLNSAAVGRLVNIVRSDISSSKSKCCALQILAHATSEVYDKVREEIPLFVKLLSKQDYHFRPAALVALYSLADAFPVYKKDIIAAKALEEVLITVDTCQWPEILLYAARFLEVVCRGSNLAPCQVEVAHNISVKLFEKNLDHYEYKFHIVHTCSALQYLSANGPLEMGEKLLRMLIRFLRSDCTAITWSALGVVGNIARLGKDDEINFLISRCKLLECLGTIVITRQWKKFQTEACQIISNIAARNKTLIKEMDKANMITILCSLLKKGDYGVKMEAAWAILTGIYGNRKIQIDEYPQMEG